MWAFERALAVVRLDPELLRHLLVACVCLVALRAGTASSHGPRAALSPHGERRRVAGRLRAPPHLKRRVFPASSAAGSERVMRPEKLDHVALFVSDPDRVAAMVCARLPFRVLERTDEFVLVGRSPELGKITLFQLRGRAIVERFCTSGSASPVRQQRPRSTPERGWPSSSSRHQQRGTSSSSTSGYSSRIPGRAHVPGSTSVRDGFARRNGRARPGRAEPSSSFTRAIRGPPTGLSSTMSASSSSRSPRSRNRWPSRVST